MVDASVRQEQDTPRPPYAEIHEYWQSKERLSSLRPLKVMTKSRREKLCTRWKNRTFREHWREIIDKCEASDFLIYKCLPFNFAWVIENDDNWVKILEGRYDEREPEPHVREWQ